MYQNYKGIIYLCLFFLLSIFLVASSCNSMSSSKGGENESINGKDDFVQLFDGETLEGWEGDPAYWRVEDGVIIGELSESAVPLEKNTFLIWQGGELGDFELITEYRISTQGNSGINYRSERVEGLPFALKGYQADIDGKNNYTGQNYEERGRTTLAYRGQKVSIPSGEGQVQNNAWTSAVVEEELGRADSLKTFINTEDDWNECHLIIKGNRLQHYINGVLMSDVTDNDTVGRKLGGLMGMQIHVGPPMKVEYRNFRIKQY